MKNRKKVRLAIGAAGLAPVTAALLGPAGVAAAAPAPAAAPAKAKTVSVHMFRPDVTCNGDTFVRSPKTGAFYLGYWYTYLPADSSYTCIGTVKAQIPDSYVPDNSRWRVRVYDFGVLESTYVKDINGPVFSLGIHKSWLGHVKVCSALWDTVLGAYIPRYCTAVPVN